MIGYILSRQTCRSVPDNLISIFFTQQWKKEKSLDSRIADLVSFLEKALRKTCSFTQTNFEAWNSMNFAKVTK